MRILKFLLAPMLLAGLWQGCSRPTAYETLRDGFVSPPDSARPGVYWYFMDGNLSKEGMTKDLEAMKEAGIGSVVFLEVNVGIPRGPVDFLSEEWKSCFQHAVKECERLGITMVLGIGPGWTGSGGPWVDAAASMQHLVFSTLDVYGDGETQTFTLPRPAPMPPYFGEGNFTPELRERWQAYYQDVAVLAFPKVSDKARIGDIYEKALYYREPYSSKPGVKPYVPRDTSSIPLSHEDVITAGDVVELTDQLQADGSITWNVPAGEWTIMRLGARNNGAVTRPSPLPGIGFECDKADTNALKAHLDRFVETLLTQCGTSDPQTTGGLKILHMDSWEMGAQNWTPRLREEFRRRRGYDPQPYYPVYAGYIVGNREQSERFLWDLRQTMQELMLEFHSGYVREYAHRHGMKLSIEPYDMNPMQDLELGATADIPMCEFWSPGGYNTSFSAIEGSSLAHLKGQHVVPSEAFTAHLDAWRQHPASMKNQTDWALAAGINRLTYHTFQHQALPDSLRPGMTMGPYGVHWDRNQTWWPYAHAYHRYVTRCQFMLQQGRTVADVLYLAPEETPFVFRAPTSALEGSFLCDRKGYSFDACPASLLLTASVQDGRICFPSGANYQLLVLPVFETMTPRLLAKVDELLRAGATVVGLPPTKAPGLTDYPACDDQIRQRATDMWGDTLTESVTPRQVGRGTLYAGREITRHIDNLYPDYQQTSDILSIMGVAEDFSSTPAVARHIHKQLDDIDYYFVANRTDSMQQIECRFRVTGSQPQLWNPVTGEMMLLDEWNDDGTTTTLPIELDRYESCFIVFRADPAGPTAIGHVSHPTETIQTLDRPWNVSFDPRWGGPEQVVFETLTDWTTHPEEGIRYYSGTAVYTQQFHWNGGSKAERYYLDLGRVKNIARVWLNGEDLGVIWTSPWRTEITDALRTGENDIRIEVTNLWPNRLIGDEAREDDSIQNGQWPDWITKGEHRPSDRYTFSTYRHYQQDSPLLESGLMGPIRILR